MGFIIGNRCPTIRPVDTLSSTTSNVSEQQALADAKATSSQQQAGLSGTNTNINTSGSTTTPAPPSPSSPGGIIGFAEQLPLIGGLFAAIEPLLHAVATVIDYSFTMFEPGQGQRSLFAVAALILLFLAYKILGGSGVVPHGPKVAMA